MKNAIIITAFDNYSYYIRTKYVEKYLRDEDYSIEILAADYDHRNKKVYREERDNLTLVHVKPYKKNLSFDRLISHYQFSKVSFEYMTCQNLQLIYIVAPPNILFYHASKYKKGHPGTKIVFDVEDMWPETLPISDFLYKLASPVLSLWKLIRNRNLNCADAIVYECNLFKEYLAPVVKVDKQGVLYFCMDGDDTGRAVKDNIGEEISFVYLGSLNNIFDSDLTAKILNSIAERKKVKLHIIGDGESKNDFLSKLQNISVMDHGIVYDEQIKHQIFSQSNFAINIMKPTVFVGLTMKSMDYFKAGMPIINNISGDTTNLINQYGSGYNFDGRIEKLVKWIEGLTTMEYHMMCQMSRKVYDDNLTKDIFYERINALLEGIV